MSNLRAVLALAIVAVTALASGCATVTKGTTQAITLHTDPDGAACDVGRESKTFASLGTTPGQVSVDKAWGAIDIACRKAGHQSTELRVESEVQGWTFGNILIGGLIGFAVDAASGAMRQYPQFITLTLVPDEFASVDAREDYFKQRVARFDEEATKAAELIDKNCTTAETCATERKSLQDLKAQRVALLRQRVDKARIRPPAAASTPSTPSDAAPAGAKPADS